MTFIKRNVNFAWIDRKCSGFYNNIEVVINIRGCIVLGRSCICLRAGKGYGDLIFGISRNQTYVVSLISFRIKLPIVTNKLGSVVLPLGTARCDIYRTRIYTGVNVVAYYLKVLCNIITFTVEYLNYYIIRTLYHVFSDICTA